MVSYLEKKLKISNAQNKSQTIFEKIIFRLNTSTKRTNIPQEPTTTTRRAGSSSAPCTLTRASPQWRRTGISPLRKTCTPTSRAPRTPRTSCSCSPWCSRPWWSRTSTSTWTFHKRGFPGLKEVLLKIKPYFKW